MWSIIARVVIAVVAAVVSAVMIKRSSASSLSPATLDDFDFPQFEEGTTVGRVWGDVWVGNWMVLNVDNFSVATYKVNA